MTVTQYSPIERRTFNKDRYDVLTQQLADGVIGIRSSETWANMMKFASRLPKYSFNNTVLIYMQNPLASYVASFGHFRKEHISINKGEKGLLIVAPIFYKDGGLGDSDDIGVKERDVNTDTRARVLSGFKIVSVFDISQTDGMDKIDILRPLKGDRSDLLLHLKDVAAHIGFQLKFGQTLPANGFCDVASRTIVVESSLDELMQCKTLAHELGHALLHKHVDHTDRTRPFLEFEAETVAYLTMNSFGVESGEYSFGYVASWTQTIDVASKEGVATLLQQFNLAYNRVYSAFEFISDTTHTITVPDADKLIMPNYDFQADVQSGDLEASL